MPPPPLYGAYSVRGSNGGKTSPLDPSAKQPAQQDTVTASHQGIRKRPSCWGCSSTHHLSKCTRLHTPCTPSELIAESMLHTQALHTQAQQPAAHSDVNLQRHVPQPRRSLRQSHPSWRTAEQFTAPSRTATQTPAPRRTAMQAAMPQDDCRLVTRRRCGACPRATPEPQGSARTPSLPDAESDGMPGPVVPPNMRSKRLRRPLMTTHDSLPTSIIATQDAIPDPAPSPRAGRRRSRQQRRTSPQPAQAPPFAHRADRTPMTRRRANSSLQLPSPMPQSDEQPVVSSIGAPVSPCNDGLPSDRGTGPARTRRKRRAAQ